MQNATNWNRTKTTPVAYRKTRRRHDVRLLTSMPAGKMVPLAAVPLLREDAVATGAINFAFEMAETVEMLLNAVNVRLMAYLVPNLAFERFRAGMDSLNAAYNGVPLNEGDDVIPYVETQAFGTYGGNDIMTYLGKHVQAGQMISTAYIEAYNLIWNFRAANRSPDIAKRTRLQAGLAPAFWQHSNFAHLVPDFDQAIMEGAVPLDVISERMPIRGLGLYERGAVTNATVTNTDGGTQAMTGWSIQDAAGSAGAGKAKMFVQALEGAPEVFAEMQQNGLQVTLANIDMARKAQAFALMRQQFTGLDDDGIIDLLMQGIQVPDQGWKQPILLSDQSSSFSMVKRFATDAGNLDQGVTNGATMMNVRLRAPRCPTGGVIMVVAEITPEQLWERQRDPYLHLQSVAGLPNALRDELDPEKVAVVKNGQIDNHHTDPDGTFAYAPLNWEWAHPIPAVGGKFYRPLVDGTIDEARQRIWAVETANPVLSEDFYVVKNMHTKPFFDTATDPFEVAGRGAADIVGNTVFGPRLIEASDDYATVIDEAPIDRIEK